MPDDVVMAVAEFLPCTSTNALAQSCTALGEQLRVRWSDPRFLCAVQSMLRARAFFCTRHLRWAYADHVPMDTEHDEPHAWQAGVAGRVRSVHAFKERVFCTSQKTISVFRRSCRRLVARVRVPDDVFVVRACDDFVLATAMRNRRPVVYMFTPDFGQHVVFLLRRCDRPWKPFEIGQGTTLLSFGGQARNTAYYLARGPDACASRRRVVK